MSAIGFSPSSLKEGRWYEYLVRFALGGAATVFTGLISSRYGASVGGLFLALPAIFCASATLIEKLCSDIAAHLDTAESAGGVRPEGDEASYHSPNRSDDWWPAGLGRPAAVGAQNDLRYAVFPETRRLVIDDRGNVSVYDTGSHRIFGVAQAQSADRTLTFTSQDGLVRIADLSKVSG